MKIILVGDWFTAYSHKPIFIESNLDIMISRKGLKFIPFSNGTYVNNTQFKNYRDRFGIPNSNTERAHYKTYLSYSYCKR